MKLPDSDLVFDGVEFIRRDHALGPNLIASVIRASGNDAVCGLLVNSRQGLELYPGSRIHVHRLIWRGQTLLHALRSGLGLLRGFLGVFLQFHCGDLAFLFDLLRGLGCLLFGFFRVLLAATCEHQERTNTCCDNELHTSSWSLSRWPELLGSSS